MKRILLAAGLCLALTACQDQQYASTRSLSPIPPTTLALMAEKDMAKDDPILIRAYKKESEFEVWKKGRDGKFALLKTYPICRWSGQLGPKTREGDRQAPEGFYTITPAQMNPNSNYYLSFNTGYPNEYDRAYGRTGAHLMVHGSCSSSGCFAMTDDAIAEVYAVAREALAGGQRNFQFQSYPFRMNPKNLAQHRLDPNIAFWRNLKEGSDHFEVTKREPKVAVCGKRYVFNGQSGSECAAPEPGIAQAVAEKQSDDNRKIADLVDKGTPAIRVVYDDGGQHSSFRQVFASADRDDMMVLNTAPRKLGDVSRPDALAAGPREIVMEPAGRTKPESIVVAKQDKPQTKVAATAPDMAGTAAAPSISGDIYQKVGGWLGSSPKPQDGPQESQVVVAADPVTPQTAIMRLPPRRKTAPAPAASERRAEATRPEANDRLVLR